jgi:hypothetical protein
MADEVIPASPDQVHVPLRDSNRRNRSRLDRKLRRPRRLQQTAHSESADNNLSGNSHGHQDVQVPSPKCLVGEDLDNHQEDSAKPVPSSQEAEKAKAGSSKLTRDHAYASARLYALADTWAPSPWGNRPQPELKFQTLGELLSQMPNDEEADLFEDLVSEVERENWMTQLTQAPGHTTPPPAPEVST